MNFIWNKNLNAKMNYRELTEQFCTKYYNNYGNIKDICDRDTLFTFHNKELIGYENYIIYLRQNGIIRFSHENISVAAQPITEDSLLINATGNIFVNDDINNKYVFTETIVLQKVCDKFIIRNNIFRLLK